MFKNLPKKIILAIFLLKSINTNISLKLINSIIYLWREFYISVRIIPKIEYFTVCFNYKDILLKQIKTKDLKDIVKISEEIKTIGVEKNHDRK